MASQHFQMKLVTCRVDTDVHSSHVVPCVVVIALSPGRCFCTDRRVPRDWRGRLTGRLHFPYRRLILALLGEAKTLPGHGSPHPMGFASCAISLRSTYSTLTGASCIAGRRSSPSHHRYLT